MPLDSLARGGNRGRAVTVAAIVGLGLVWGLGAAAATDASDVRAISSAALSSVRTIAVQHQGRLKPFDSFAWETLDHITGSDYLGRDPAVVTVLSMIAEPEQWQETPLVSVPFAPLRDALGMDRHATRISYQDLVATRKLMRMLPPIVEKQQRDAKLTVLENETMDTFQRFADLAALFQHRIMLVPPAGTDPSWVAIEDPAGYPEAQQRRARDAWATLLNGVRAHDGTVVAAAGRTLAATLRELQPAAYPPAWRLQLEVAYNDAKPFRLARWGYALALLGWLLGWAARRPPLAAIGRRILFAAFAVHAAGILLRVVLGGRPPVSNFYETMLWLPFVGVAVALIVERALQVRALSTAAAILAAMTLALADHVPLDSSIAPVAAVLRSNYWLTIHVLTIVASYGALALATVLAHVYCVQFLGRRPAAALARLETALYRVLQVGVVLLAGGIMLGAVWANASWGRYWGWDPKETWALITLLWFLALLHGRLTGWLQGLHMALTTITGFFLLLMTYYGVSFYLVGLHSYAGGHAKPLPALLVGYLVAEALFLLWMGQAALRRRPPSA